MPLDDTNWSPDTQIDEATALLIRARGFLERGWCRWAQAKDAGGNYTEPTSERAVAWCAYGALLAAGLHERGYGNDGYGNDPAVKRLQAATGNWSIGGFNNRQETVEPVLAAFDRAIAACGSP
jgi:hypothetical protein